MSEVDWILRDTGGLKPILRKLFRARRRHTIDSAAFFGFILDNAPAQTHALLERIFRRKLMGQPTAAPPSV